MSSKTIDHMNLYVSIAPYKHETASDQTFDSLRVYVSYRKGSGFVVGYHPGWGNGSIWGCLFDFSKNPLTAGASVLAKAATKNSVKELQAMYDNLNAGTARKIIAFLFDQRKWEVLNTSLQHIALNSAWATEEQLWSLANQLGANAKNNENENQKNSETMATNVKGADLIGKTIVVTNNEKIKYVIKSVDGDKFMTEFIMEGRPAIACPVPMAQMDKMLSAGTWKIEGATATETPKATATEEVEEVDDIKVEPAKAEEPKAEKPKAESKPKAKSEPSASSDTDKPMAGKLKYKTYTNKKGKTCAKIVGFGENDAAYVNASDLHGSATYERDKKGEKVFYLIFGPRYAEAAKEVCDALNDGKTMADCKAIIDQATEERDKKREEWKQKREERKAQANEQEQPKAKTEKYYTEQEVRKAFKSLADAAGMDVAEFEPIISAMKAAA